MGGHVQMERTILRQVPIEEQQGVGESLTLRDIWKIRENLKIWSQNFDKQQKHVPAGGNKSSGLCGCGHVQTESTV